MRSLFRNIFHLLFYKNNEVESLKFQLKVQEEISEIAIKTGRRMMHDFHHILNDVPKTCPYKQDYYDRLNHWKKLFYPDNGCKNYRMDLYRSLEELEDSVERLKKQIRDLGHEPDNSHLPF